MRILITGICGFVGRSLAGWIHEHAPRTRIFGMDSLVRPGSEGNVGFLKSIGARVSRGDVRQASDLDALPAADYVIDAAANPSVLAGLPGRMASRCLVEHNLLGSLNVLEYCRRAKAGLVLLSTSRVYSIPALASLPLVVRDAAFQLKVAARLPPGVSRRGLREDFPTEVPVSLYGATKLASEVLALEYGQAFGFPVWVNRCGVLAGAGQFGTAEQGVFSYWIHAYARRCPLRYTGLGGRGHQVRDVLHPRDLAALVWKQIGTRRSAGDRLFNVGGGPANAVSLAQLTAWCRQRLGPHAVRSDPRERPFDIPWMVMDNARVERAFHWKALTGVDAIWEEILQHARDNPSWMDAVSGRIRRCR